MKRTASAMQQVIVIDDTHSDDNAEEKLKSALQDLQGIISSNIPKATFCCSGYLNELPVLKIANSTMVTYPCTANLCQELISKYASKAPFGLAEQTILDEQVRKGWQIAASLVQCQSKPFADLLNGNSQTSELLQTICTRLTPDTTAIYAQFYKMLIYEKDNFFNAHKDTLREKNHFGSLVIFLPCEYEGGELCVRWQGEQLMYQHSLANDKGMHNLRCQWVAFFSDCEHEILPVTSGYRVALTYNLYFAGTKIPRAPTNGSNRVIQQLDTVYHFGCQVPLGIVCQHEYALAGLSPTLLKGTDAILYQMVQQSVQYDIRLEPIQVDISGDCDEDDEDAEEVFNSNSSDDTTVSVKSMLSNKTLLSFDRQSDIPLAGNDEVQFLTNFQHLKAEASDSSINPTGNEGTTFELQYQIVAMIVSKRIKQEEATNEPPAKKQKTH